MSRNLGGAGLLLLAVVASLPAYARVYTGGGWQAPVLVAAGVSLAIAVLARWARRGGVVSMLVSVAALLVLLPWLVGLTDRPVLPTSDVLGALRELWLQALVELQETPSPTPILPGLLLVTTLAFWAATHAAHELFVRARRPGSALLVLTVLWAAPLIVPLPPGRTWPHAVPFVAAAALVLLGSSRWSEQGEPAVRLPATGVAVATVVVAVAALLPAALPGYAQPAWVSLGSGAQPRGYQPIVDISERLRLPEERDVLLVHASQRTYLRLAGLDTFDGFTWRLGPAGAGSFQPSPGSLVAATGRLPAEQPAAQTERVFVDVEVLELENIYVPVPYQPVEVLGPQRDQMVWSTEGGFLATWDTVDGATSGTPRIGIREGITYRVEAARPAPSFQQLVEVSPDPADVASWTQLPRSYPALREQAAAVYEVADAGTTVEQVLALQDWFVGRDGGFTYDLDVPALRDDDALERFVLEDKRGYCEYFATAMAVMLRETGIPARVAVGFLPGRVTEEADPAAGRELTQYTVSTTDAHAWVEVLFPGYGWVSFEPTPRSDESQVVPTADDLAPVENQRERRARELRELIAELPEDQPVPDTPDLPDQDVAPPDDPAAAGGAGADGSGGQRALAPLVALLTAAVVVAIGAAAVVRRRGRRRAAGAEGDAANHVVTAQRSLLATARRYGIGRARHETIRDVVARWEREGRIDDRGRRFARTAQAAAFGGEVDDALAREARQLVTDLEGMLRTSVPGRDRLLGPVRVGVDRLRGAARSAVGWLHRPAAPAEPPPRVPTRVARRQPGRRSGSTRTASGDGGHVPDPTADR